MSETRSDVPSPEQARKGKKEYSPPKVICTEVIEGRAVVCAMADDVTCSEGPIQS